MRILIADFDASRAKLHAEAVAARGYVVDRAAHGAAALEVALEGVPDVVVCPIDLPIIDGARLAEILRGNPRTRHASFVFLVKDELDAPMAMDPRDGTVVAPWLEEDLLDHIDAFLERNARFGETRSDTEIEGKLTQISLVDLLQIFAMNKRSGTVRITRGGMGTGSILIRTGAIIDASVPLSDGTYVVGEKALYRLLTWKDGRFEFIPGSISEAGRIQKPGRALLLEGMRQLDEWEKLRRDLPSEAIRLALRIPREQVPANVHPLTRDVIDAVEAYRRVGEVVDHCPYPDYQVLRVLSDLIARGTLEQELHDAADDRGSTADGLFTPSQLRRLREWSAALRPRAGPVVKVLVVAPTRELIRAFHEALRECPDFMSDGRLVREPERIGGLGTLGHVPLGEGLSLRLVAVPAAPRYAPLWEVAAYGMLGAIILPRGPFGPALEETEAAFTRLQAERPRSIVQLILADSPALSPEARGQLGQLQGGSLFVLPAAPSRERIDVLRSLLSRLVP